MFATNFLCQKYEGNQIVILRSHFLLELWFKVDVQSNPDAKSNRDIIPFHKIYFAPNCKNVTDMKVFEIHIITPSSRRTRDLLYLNSFVNNRVLVNLRSVDLQKPPRPLVLPFCNSQYYITRVSEMVKNYVGWANQISSNSSWYNASQYLTNKICNKIRIKKKPATELSPYFNTKEVYHISLIL